MKGWDKTVAQIVREAHTAGCMDTLRAILDCFDMEPDHSCMARTWAEQLYRDPETFNQFVRDSQARREDR